MAKKPICIVFQCRVTGAGLVCQGMTDALRSHCEDRPLVELPNHYGVNAPHCPCCNIRITIHQKFNPGHCGAIACALKFANDNATRREKKERKAIKKQRKTAVRNAKRAMPEIAHALGVSPESVKVGAVPYQNKPVVALPAAARALFMAHLTSTIAKAYSNVGHSSFIGPVPPAPLHPPTAIEEVGCTACQGHCCEQGRGRHAFLSQSVFENLFHINPDLSVDDVTAVYVAALPDRSVKKACVFQSNTGCTLPRDWRSDVCNTYRCKDLIRLSDKFPPGRDTPVAVVGVEGKNANILAHRETVGTITIAKDEVC